MALSMSILASSYNIAAISPQLGIIRQLFRPGPVYMDLLATSVLIGAMVAAVVGGPMADRFGRLRILLFDLLTFILGGVIGALSWNMWALLASRVVVGLGVGLDYVVVFVYASEIFRRGSAPSRMMLIMFFANFGIIIAYFSGFLFDMVGAGLSWRLELASGVVVAAIPIWLRARLPESYAWLQAEHRPVRDVVRRVMEMGRGLFKVYSIPWFLYQIGDQGLAVYMPYLLSSDLHVTFTDGAGYSVIVKAFTIPASFAAIVLVRRLGMLRLQFIGFIARGASLLMLSIFILASLHMDLAFVILLALAFFFGAMGPDKTTVIRPTGWSDTQTRGAFQGISEASGRLGGILGVLAFAVAPDVLPGSGFLLISFTCLAGGVVTVLIGRAKASSLASVDPR
ncbi:MFS transporter [Thermogymnomonas acidicola]|uniref:MFS transporter n=1 Tax=Thermogymnomonas acidicola TaxID=399579 RepID=A0AA37F956_9ARCH|nr:MFS transporter [Thermogymnomonas acidicola]